METIQAETAINGANATSAFLEISLPMMANKTIKIIMESQEKDVTAKIIEM